MTEIEILTERIKLRLINLSDLDSIHNLHSLPETKSHVDFYLVIKSSLIIENENH